MRSITGRRGELFVSAVMRKAASRMRLPLSCVVGAGRASFDMYSSTHSRAK